MAWVSEAALPFVPAYAYFFSAIFPASGGYYVYVLGDGDDQVYKYNITTNLWQHLADPLTRLAGSISISPDGGKLAAHGSPSSTRLYIYDVAGDSWTTSSAAPQINTTNVRIESHVWADNDTIWCQVRAEVPTLYVKFFRYVVSTDTWTSYPNSVAVTLGNSKCMCISTNGARLYAGNCGASYKSTTKYTIATDTYAAGPSIFDAYYFAVSVDRHKLWFGPKRVAPATHVTITRWVNPDTEVLESAVFSEYDPADKGSNLPAGVYGVIMCIAGFMTTAPRNLSETFVSLPTVTTDPPTAIEATTATGNGNITDIGGENCDKRGFVYNTSSHGDPGNTAPADSAYANYVEESGSFGIGAFTGSLTSLEPSTPYYVRAYAHNSVGYSYGDEVSFTTLVAIPTVTTDAATGEGAIAATLNGTLDGDGGEACECGFEWGLDTFYGITTPTQSKTTGESFSEVIGGLFPNTVYHFRAIATNSAGTGRGDDMTFTTALVINRAFALAREEL